MLPFGNHDTKLTTKMAYGMPQYNSIYLERDEDTGTLVCSGDVRRDKDTRGRDSKRRREV